MNKTIMEQLDDIITLAKQLEEQTKDLKEETNRALNIATWDKDLREDLRNEALAMTQSND